MKKTKCPEFTVVWTSPSVSAFEIDGEYFLFAHGTMDRTYVSKQFKHFLESTPDYLEYFRARFSERLLDIERGLGHALEPLEDPPPPEVMEKLRVQAAVHSL